MANLSAYIDFTVVLSKATVTPTIKIIDPDFYPGGVNLTLQGYMSITQPDGITITFGSFASPIVFWNGSALEQPEVELRLNNISSFQNGGYTFIYYVRATGYDDTTLTKVLALNYTRPVTSVTNAFDIFTPSLSLTDATVFFQSGFSLADLDETWSVDFTPNGTPVNLALSGTTVSLIYLTDYWDCTYNIQLTVTPQWVLDAPYAWVFITDQLVKTVSFSAQIPQTIDELDDGLQVLKDQADAAACNCNTGSELRDRYIYASTLYGDYRRKGCDNEIAGLTTTYFQLIKLLNNNVNPVYENTNDPITGYDFECGGTGSVNWDNIVNKPATILREGLVGGSGMPIAGAVAFNDSNLMDVDANRIVFFRNGIPQLASNQGDGDSFFTKVSSVAFIVVTPAFLANEKLILIILPL